MGENSEIPENGIYVVENASPAFVHLELGDEKRWNKRTKREEEKKPGET